MSFTSTIFLSIVLPVLVGGHFLMPTKLRKAFLLIASLLFYVWVEPVSSLVLVFLTLFSFGLTRPVKRRRKSALFVAVMIDVAILALYKYNSFLVSLSDGRFPRFVLAAGMSFYVFQLISYLVDIYGGKVEPGSFGDLLLYVSFIPKIPCGPIVRFAEFGEGLNERSFSADNFASGLRRFFVGLVKKVLLADMMARIVNPVFATNVSLLPSAYCWTAAIAYTIQIYFDFSGYSDMAIGIARVFNFKFPENFDFPYSSRSIQEFWRRWHISLSLWFRDYVYFPLGGSRRGVWRTCLNTMVVFLLCGVWHGSTWTFFIWGLCHGAILIIERIGFKRILDKLPTALANAYVFVFALFSWVLFRAPSLEYALGFMRNMVFGNPAASVHDFSQALFFVDYSGIILLLAGIALSYPTVSGLLGRLDKRTHGVLLAVAAILAYAFAMTGSVSPGIYENF
jgi:alginate O-acetyltransferase complex protein AlgI